MKYLKFFMDMKDEGRIIWKKGSAYKVTYENFDIYYVESEIQNNIYGIDKKSEKKKYEVIEKYD